MKKIMIDIFGIILFFIGFLFIICPICNRYYSKIKIENSAKEFKNDITNMNRYHLQRLLTDSMTYNTRIFFEQQKNLTSEISYQKESINIKSYGIDNEIFGYLQIPKIDVLLPIYLGATNENLNLGAVHLSETSLPIGGKNTNTVIAAHRGMYRSAALKNIDKLKVGDMINVKNYWTELHYQVTGYEIIDPDNLNSLYITEGEDRLTIFSCNPPKDSKRYVVYAARVE